MSFGQRACASDSCILSQDTRPCLSISEWGGRGGSFGVGVKTVMPATFFCQSLHQRRRALSPRIFNPNISKWHALLRARCRLDGDPCLDGALFLKFPWTEHWRSTQNSLRNPFSDVPLRCISKMGFPYLVC